MLYLNFSGGKFFRGLGVSRILEEFQNNSKSEFRKNVNQNSNKMLEEFLEGTVLAGKNTVSEKMSLIAIWDELYQKSSLFFYFLNSSFG